MNPSAEQTLEALARSKQRANSLLRTLLHTIPDLVWLKDENGVYIACNRMFERFYGASEAEIVGKTDYDFVDREQADSFREHDLIAMRSGKIDISERWITFADDGHRVYVETIKVPMHDDSGRLMGVLGIARDITERRAASRRTASRAWCSTQSARVLYQSDQWISNRRLCRFMRHSSL